MAKKTKYGVVTKTPASGKQLVVQQINVMSADRSRKDISNFKMALESAESISYPQRVSLFDLYDDALLDPHLSGIVAKRIDQTLNKKIVFKANGKRLEAMDELIQSQAFRTMVAKIIESKLFGFSGLEFLIGPKVAFKEIPRRHIKPERGIIAIEQYDLSGIDYTKLWNIWVIGEQRDLGLLLKCVPYAIYKRGTMADWSQYIEIFGQPVRIIYYDAYDEKTKIEVKQVLDESGSSLALMIPKQAQFEMKDGKQSNGDGQLQERFAKALDDAMSVVILGATETTTSSRSSGYAQSAEHGKQQSELVKSDMDFVTKMLNSEQCKAILKTYGYPVESGHFEFEKEVNLAELAERVKIDTEIAMKLKTPISDDYVYETYGIPKPPDYEALKKKQSEHQEEEPGVPANPPKNKPKRKMPPTPGRLDARPDFIEWLRMQLADFFDPAP